MEVNDQNLAQMRAIILQTLTHDNNSRRQGEQLLLSAQEQQGFSIVTLELISRLTASVVPQDVAVRLSAAVMFKNLVKKRWEPEDDEVKCIPQVDRSTIKRHLVDLMCSTTVDVQKQLAEALSIIAKFDFPEKWNDLLPLLVTKLQIQDMNVINGVMQTANSIMKRFRYVFKSDELYVQLLYCLNGFQEPLLQIFLQLSNLISVQCANPESSTIDLALGYQTLRLICRIFYSLNWQDIPEFFENNVEKWMTEFSKYLSIRYLTLNLPGRSTVNSSTESGPVEMLQSSIIENLVLYATKYEEVFEPFLQQFTNLIWQLLIQVTADVKYDILATISIKFLTTVSSKHMNTHLFNEEALRQMIEQIIVPNLSATNSDVELFEENPLDYIRKDIEGSDQDTRRRCAVDLVRALLKYFSAPTTNLCVGYINAMLQQYNTNSKDWKSKDAALHLVIAVSVISSSATNGAGELNPGVNILEIFHSHVLPEIHDTNVNARPIVKADSLKLICTFRSHFPTSFLLELLPHVLRHLSSDSVVVQTYAALTIEKFLLLRDKSIPGNPVKLGKEYITPALNPLFSSLFAVLNNPDLPENDYVMKCIMRVLSVVGSDILPVTELVLQHLNSALERVCKNPANPHFNHYLFECIAILIRSSCLNQQNVAAVSQFEALLFPPFQIVLQMDVVEFIPYVFQILAQLLSYRPAGLGLSEAYKSLFPPLLSPALYERRGNVPALTDLLVSYCHQGIGEIIAARQLDGVLGVFQKLLASKATEVSSFKLLKGVISSASPDVLSSYLPVVLQLLLMRMRDNKTPLYSKLFIHSICFMILKIGAIQTYSLLEAIQGGMTEMIIVQIWTPAIDSIAKCDESDLSEIVRGGSMLLCESPINKIPKTWAELLTNILKLLSDPSQGGAKETMDNYEDDEIGVIEFDNTYSKLAFAQSATVDAAVTSNGEKFFIDNLAKLCRESPGQYSSFLPTCLDQVLLANLQAIVTRHGVNLA